MAKLYAHHYNTIQYLACYLSNFIAYIIHEDKISSKEKIDILELRNEQLP